MHSAFLGGYRNTVQPVYGSAHDGFVILPELPLDRFRDLRSLLIGGTAKPEIVIDIFREFLDIRGQMQSAWHTEMPFRAPETVLFKFRIVPHFFALLLKYRASAIARAMGDVVDYILTDRRIVIHGDFSPKNIMVGESDHYLIDAEAAGFGNEDFDPFFFLSQLLIECAGCGHRRIWSEVAQEAVAMHFSHEAPDLHRASMCSSMLATMMLARIEGLARPQVYAELNISPEFVARIKNNVVSPVTPHEFIREIGSL
jgi:hypothetical protein